MLEGLYDIVRFKGKMDVECEKKIDRKDEREDWRMKGSEGAGVERTRNRGRHIMC